MHINLNIKGRNPNGIVDPKDQYQLEEEIITKLYDLKHPVTGNRIVALALRNRDAIVLGLGGPESGDIVYCIAEQYGVHHGDSLSTFQGEDHTSVSPIFIAAGRASRAVSIPIVISDRLMWLLRLQLYWAFASLHNVRAHLLTRF